MSFRYRPFGIQTWLPIECAADYACACEELERLKVEPLGTPATEGIQDLIEAILDYEEANCIQGDASADSVDG